MVEAAAEADEELMNKYLEAGELTEEEIKHGLRTRTIAGEIHADAVRHGLQEQGRAAHARRRDRLPALAGGHPAVEGTDDDEKTVMRKADDDEKFSALAFKLMTDPFVGQLTFVRVYSGVLKSGDSVYNPIKRQEGAHRPDPADARQPARGDQGSPAPATSPPAWA
jgi:elongation factor G